MSETSNLEMLRMENAELRQTVRYLQESMAKAEAFIQTARKHPSEHERPKEVEYPAMKTIWTPFGDLVTIEDARLAIAAASEGSSLSCKGCDLITPGRFSGNRSECSHCIRSAYVADGYRTTKKSEVGKV